MSMKHQFEGKIRKIRSAVKKPTRKEAAQIARRYGAELAPTYTVATRDSHGHFARASA